MDDQELVEQPQRRALALHQVGDVDQHLDQRRVEGVDVTQVVLAVLGVADQLGQKPPVSLDDTFDRLGYSLGLSAPENPLLADPAQLDVFELEQLEPAAVVVEVFVDMVLADHVGEEIADPALTSDEDGHGDGALAAAADAVVDEGVEMVDGADELVAGLLPEPQEQLVDEEDHAAEAHLLGVLGHSPQPLGPVGVDLGGAAGEVEVFARQLLLPLGAPRGALLEVVPVASDLGLAHLAPEGLAVALGFTAGLVEHAFDVQKLEGRLAAALQRSVETLVDHPVEALVLSSCREHVNADDEELRRLDPAPMPLGESTDRVVLLVPGFTVALEEHAEEAHEVALAAAEAAVDEPPHLLAPLSTSFEALEDARELLTDVGGDHVAVDDPAGAGTGASVAALEPDHETQGANLVGRRQVECLFDRECHQLAFSPSSSSCVPADLALGWAAGGPWPSGRASPRTSQ